MWFIKSTLAGVALVGLVALGYDAPPQAMGAGSIRLADSSTHGVLAADDDDDQALQQELQAQQEMQQAMQQAEEQNEMAEQQALQAEQQGQQVEQQANNP